MKVTSKFPYLDQWESSLVYQPFVSSCRFYGLRATGQNIRYSGVNCALGPSKSIRYSGVCFHIFYRNSAGLSYVVRYNGVSALCTSQIEASTSPGQPSGHLNFWKFFCSNSPPHRAKKLFKCPTPWKITRLLF